MSCIPSSQIYRWRWRYQEVIWSVRPRELGFRSSQSGSRVCALGLSTVLSPWWFSTVHGVQCMGEGEGGLGGEIRHLSVNQTFILEPLTYCLLRSRPFPSRFTNNHSVNVHLPSSGCFLLSSSSYWWENRFREWFPQGCTSSKWCSLDLNPSSLCSESLLLILLLRGLKTSSIWESAHGVWTCVLPDHPSPVVCICRIWFVFGP